MRRGVFGGLTSIREIFLSHNSLEEIPSPPISLTTYHLSHNNVSEIKGRRAWPTMNSLLYMDLDYNNLGQALTPGR